MNQRPSMTDQAVPASLEPTEGWHCSHFYYAFDRAILASLSENDRVEGKSQVVAALDPQATDAPQRLQTSIVSGHKADFGLMIMDPNPLVIDRVHQKLLSSKLGQLSGQLIRSYPFQKFQNTFPVSNNMPSASYEKERPKAVKVTMPKSKLMKQDSLS